MANVEPRGTHRIPVLLALLFLLTACGSDAIEASQEPAATSSVGGNDAPSFVIENDGTTALEGHTPRGFNGSGVGLFAGDELNANFPQDDGVQIWLTFALPSQVVEVGSAVLRSDALTIRGNPFETLGDLQIAPVRYEAFSPAVVDLDPIGPTVTCPAPDGPSFECDVTEAVAQAATDRASNAQFRLRFERASDPDGMQDMALFFLSDSNTNEAGIFTLHIG